MKRLVKELIRKKRLRAFDSKSGLQRKFKIFVTLGLIGFVIFGGLAIWAGIATFRYTESLFSQALQSPAAYTQIENFKSGIQSVEFQPLNCWSKAQNLLSIQPWVERPALDNIKHLKVACFQQKPEGSTI